MKFLWLLGLFGLFSTGAGGRHDWMRFHAGDVECPNEICAGRLKWEDSDRKVLKCTQCKAKFTLRKKP